MKIDYLFLNQKTHALARIYLTGDWINCCKHKYCRSTGDWRAYCTVSLISVSMFPCLMLGVKSIAPTEDSEKHFKKRKEAFVHDLIGTHFF